MPSQVEEKTMVPTVVVGIGGTGTEILARVRRLTEETYGNLSNFPILSFLAIDTDKDYELHNPEAAGSPFKENEQVLASVSSEQAKDMVDSMDSFPWISSWFPSELERNIAAIEAGAGQIRACGRFAFFCNYHAIRDRFIEAVRRVKGRENFMSDQYGIRVNTNAINVFVTGSLSGGTGSGMLIDIGYCIRKWIKGEGSPLITAIMPMPNAFVGIDVRERVLSNGYAAMMELSYFSDYRTEYIANFSKGQTDEIRSNRAPYDFTYLVGTKNGETDFKLSQIQGMIAQNVFLDLTSDFAPHKRSIRDNIKGSWAQADPIGRGFPKNFMSFGLSTIEIPIAQIRATMGNRLAQDLINWWLNKTVSLPPQMLELVRGNILKGMRLTEAEMLSDLSAANDRSYLDVIVEWVNSIRREIANDHLLECTQQGLNILGAEKGKILKFVDGYLQPKVNEYCTDHFREIGTDERIHGDFLKKIYSNRDAIIQQGRKALESELYRILIDRNQGPRFADAFIATARQVFTDASERFRQHQSDIWEPKEAERQEQYNKAIQNITFYKEKFGATKEAKMEEYCDSALSGLEGWLTAKIQSKARILGLEVIQRLEEHLKKLETRFNRFKQKLIQSRDFFKTQADLQASSADALVINGIKLYDRQELNVLYQDLIETLAGASEGSKTFYEVGMNVTCSTMSEDILEEASPLWKESRAANEVMHLFDITEIPDVQEEDFREIIFRRTRKLVENAPESSMMKRDLTACDRLFKVFADEGELVNNLRIARDKSKPLILMNQATLSAAGFTPSTNINVAILGGSNTSDPAAKKILNKLEEFIRNESAVKPLGEPERHRIVFVQETGGFSLRCIDGMRELRQSYQDWKGKMIEAKRKQLRGESYDLPIPVHLQKEPPFWDLFPEDAQIFSLVVQGRALKILRQELNRTTKEQVIRYTRQTEIGSDDVDIASSWEETPQVLEVPVCRDDREAIQLQLSQRVNSAETSSQKHELFQQLVDYLEERASELNKLGGKDSPDYKREATIVLEFIKTHKLKVDSTELSNLSISTPPVLANNAFQDSTSSSDITHSYVFCTECGVKNPTNSKFCFKCGTQLVELE